MFSHQTLFSSLEFHSRNLQKEFRKLPKSIHARGLEIILILFCKVCFYLLDVYFQFGVEKPLIRFLPLNWGSEG